MIEPLRLLSLDSGMMLGATFSEAFGGQCKGVAANHPALWFSAAWCCGRALFCRFLFYSGRRLEEAAGGAARSSSSRA